MTTTTTTTTNPASPIARVRRLADQRAELRARIEAAWDRYHGTISEQVQADVLRDIDATGERLAELTAEHDRLAYGL